MYSTRIWILLKKWVNGCTSLENVEEVSYAIRIVVKDMLDLRLGKVGVSTGSIF